MRGGLVVRRMAGDRALVLAACATALFTTTVLAALVGYAGSVTREGLRRTLAEATFDSSGTRIAAHVPAGGFGTAQRQVDRSLRRIYRDVPLSVSAGMRSDSYTLPGQERRDHPDLTAFASYTGIEGHARLARGRWPRQGAQPEGEVEAVLPTAAARWMRADVGGVLTLRGRIDTDDVVRVRVVGLFDASRPDEYFWQGDRLITTGAERLDYTTYGPLVVRPEVFAGRFTATGADVRWTVLPDLRDVDVGEIGPLGDRAARSAAAFQSAGTGRFTVVTSLPALAGEVRGAVQVAWSTMLTAVLQIVVLAGYAWVLVARLMAGRRRTEVSLLRTRGAGMRRLAAINVAEGLLIVLPAAVLGPLLATPLLRLAGRVPAVRASGVRLDAGPLLPLWTVSVAAALVCAAVLTVPVLRGAGRTFVEVQAEIGRAPRSRLRGAGTDLALLVIAALAIWQLTRYGAAGTGGGGRTGLAGVDPFIVSGPALALLAGGMLLLRALPVASRAAERATARRRGLVAVLGARQVSRRPLGYAGPALLLVMAVAVGVLSVTTMATWRVSQGDQADFQTGADLRLTPPEADGPTPLGQSGRYSALPGVTATTAVLHRDVTVGGRPGVLLAADTRALDSVLRVQPGLRRDLRLGALAASRPAPPLLTVPGRPERLLFDLRLDAGSGDAPSRVTLEATIEDARGQAQRVELPGLVPDGRTRTIAVDADALAGPGGVLSYPLSVRGLHYVYDDNLVSEGELGLVLERVRGEGTGQAAMPDGARREAFSETTAVTTPVQPEGAAIRIPATPPLTGWGFGTGTTVHAMLATSTTPPPSRNGGTVRSGVQPAVPGVISAGLAERAGVRPGGTVSVAAAEGDQPVTVIGVVDALPSTDPGGQGVLVDLPTLTERRLAAGSAHADSVSPDEWWTAVRGSRTSQAVSALKAGRTWGEAEGDRAALREQLRGSPLGAALQGALVLGFGVALSFAAIAFAVNAAVSVGERTREFAVLRTLGVRTRQVAGLLAVEQAFLVALGLAGGTLLGLAVARLTVRHIVVGVQAGPAYPPAGLVVPWPLVGAVLGGAALVLAGTLALVISVLGRRDAGAGLRIGEEI